MNDFCKIVMSNDLVLMNTIQLCYLPYPNHPKGCPNAYGKCEERYANLLSEICFDLVERIKPMYIVWSEFDLEAHAKKMKLKHLHWSKRQCRCVLYWQGTSRAMLKKRVELSIKELGGEFKVIICPEYFGVNVYKTCENVGLILDPIKDLKICHHVALFIQK